ncbi:retrovirus-related Pol polyprotein from transposon 17.6 [Trichonephila clavipes]|nr:retrovirus-related Pol polyprotein from transposon 17.6 [Trichonephila clavipes]
MATPGSLFTPTPLGHEDNLGVRYHPRVNTSQWRPSQFNFPHHEVEGAAGLGGLQENRDQDPTDFIYNKLKVHKKLGLRMTEEALVDHIFVRLEPQVQDYVEVRNPTTTAQLLEVLAKFEDIRARKCRVRGIVVMLNDEVGMESNCESGCQRNQWFENRNELNRNDQRFDRGYQSGNRVQSENFSQGDRRNRGSNTNFSRGTQRQGGRLNVLKVKDDQNDQSIEKVVTTIEEGNVEIDLTKTGLEESQKKELQDLFNSFKGLFSDKPGLTHVLYHEIDTGDKPPVVSRPYRYDRRAFDAVKTFITEAPVLKLLDFPKPFELFTDASSIGIDAVLNQEQRPVLYASRTLSSAEKNYTVTETECLAVVWALNKFRTYLGSLPVKVITDHAALTRLTHGKNLSSRIIRPQANRTERVNRDLLQMIANYVNDQHDTWDRFLSEFTYAIRMAVNEATGKTPAELFLGRKLITSFQKLVMVSDGTELALGDIGRLFDEARRNTMAKLEKWAKYYDRRRRDMQIKVNTTDKCGPLIRSAPSSWSTAINRTKRGRKETLAYKRSRNSELGGPGKKQTKGPKNKGEKRQLTLSSNNELQYFRTRGRGEEIVMPSTSGYNLRPRRGAKVESRPTNEKRTQQGGPVRARGRREHQYSPTSKSKQGQLVGRPEAEMVNNSITRRGKEEREREQQTVQICRGSSRCQQQEIRISVRKQIVMASKRKHSTLTLKEKLEVLKRLDKGEGVTKLATEFNVGKASVGDINEWMEEDGKQPNF